MVTLADTHVNEPHSNLLPQHPNWNPALINQSCGIPLSDILVLLLPPRSKYGRHFLSSSTRLVATNQIGLASDMICTRGPIHPIQINIQISAKRMVRGCEKFVPALAYLFFLALPGSCLARIAYFLDDLGTVIG